MRRRIDFPNAVRSLRVELRLAGVVDTAKDALSYWLPPQSNRWYPSVAEAVGGRRTLEIGGPSPIFQPSGGRVPVYPLLKAWDNVDFAGATIWRNPPTTAGASVSNGSVTGSLVLSEATNLSTIASGTYGAVLASHLLEHLANPLKALREWWRVLTPNGVLLMIVPEGARSFDYLRPTTAVDHIRSDFAAGMDENDMSHLDEVLRLHDRTMDRGAGTFEQFAERCRRNPEFRAMHHHVFTLETLGAIVGLAGFRPLLSCRVPPKSLLILAQRASIER